jgi:hypothetical protein
VTGRSCFSVDYQASHEISGQLSSSRSSRELLMRAALMRLNIDASMVLPPVLPVVRYSRLRPLRARVAPCAANSCAVASNVHSRQLGNACSVLIKGRPT